MDNKYLVNNFPIIECHLTMPKIGAWLASDVLIDSPLEFKIGDNVVMQFLDQTFNGTIIDTGVFKQFQMCTIVGGTGKMPDYLVSKSYNSIPLGQVVKDIARATGHVVSDTSNVDLLNSYLLRWSLLKLQASLAITKLLEPSISLWRILPDGTLWVGKETYAPLNPDDFLIIEKFPEQGRWNIYNESYLIQPLTSLDGINIQQVEYYLKENDLTMSVFFTDTFGDSIDNLTNQDDNILYNSIYRCQVVQQHSDGTVDLLPNPSNDVIKNGFSSVPIIYPLPGMKITVPTNTICFVQFANGDPQYPRVFAWENTPSLPSPPTDASSVEIIHATAKAAARKYDTVEIGTLIITGTGVANYTFTPTVQGVPGVPVTAIVGTPLTLSGDISGGSLKVTIG